METEIITKVYTSRTSQSSHYGPRQAGSDVIRKDWKRRDGKTRPAETSSSFPRNARVAPRSKDVLLYPQKSSWRTPLEQSRQEYPGKATVQDENIEQLETVKQCLQSLEDELIAVDDHVDDCGVVLDNWFAKHADSQFPGLGVRAIAVPPSIVFTPRVQVLEACSHCSPSEACPATFFRVLGQESDQKGRQALSIVYTGFQMLNEALEREGQPTMFVMANVHWDNILAWFKRGKQREKSIDSLFPHVFNCGLYNSIPAERHVDDMIVVHKDRILFIQVKAVGSSESGSQPEVIQRSLNAAIKQLQQGRALFNNFVTRSRDMHVLLVVATPMLSRADLPGSELAADEKIFCRPILTSLRGVSPACHIWCEGVFSEKPEGFVEFPMEVVLRNPPAVQRLLYHVDWREERKARYVTEPANLEVAAKGPIPLCVRHERHVPQVRVTDCAQCANEIAAIFEELGIRRRDLVGPANPDHHRRQHVAVAPRRLSDFEVPVALLINLPRALYKKEGKNPYVESRTYEQFMDRVRDSALVKTLRDKGLEAEVKVRLSCNDLDDVRQRETLLTTWVYNFVGLESGVVICLPGDEAVDAKTDGSADACSHGDLSERETPAPGACHGGNPGRAEGQDQDGGNSPGPERTRSRSEETRETCKQATARASDHLRMSARYWGRRDLDRLSEWDKTGVLVAGSRCLAQLVLIVP